MTQAIALAILKTGANVFLTGEPGSGKTYLANQYIDWLRGFGIEPGITASTGIAATHLNGLTIHSWSGIGIKEKLSQADLEKIIKTKLIASRVKRCKVLIIDEISMLPASSLDAVDLVCRRIRQNKAAFGGLQVVAVGDFFQLPPVSGANEKIAQFAFSADAWAKANFTVCYLTEQYRQDDPDFLAILSALRLSNFNEQHLSLLQGRLIKKERSPQNITRIFSHNIDVDFLNHQELAKLPGKEKEYTMFSRGRENFVERLKKGCLSPEVLKLKIGALVMFTKNNLKQGFVNGTIGTVVGFDKESQEPLVETESGQTIKVSPMEWTIEEGGSVKAIISQIPLRLAWAITVHKSQGMSLDVAVMDLSKTFEFGQGYVALSRVRRLSGLYLLGYNQKAFLTNPAMQQQDQSFRDWSEKAWVFFQAMPEIDLLGKQNDFLVACGASLKKQKQQKVKEKAVSVKKEKGASLQTTLALVKQGKALPEIVQERGLAFGTIISHLEDLVLRNKINQQEVEGCLGERLLAQAPEIIRVFHELQTDKLQPVFERFNGQYSYNDLRLARLLLPFAV